MWNEVMFGLVKNIYIELITSTVSASNHTKYVSLNNHQYTTQPKLINLHPYEYRQELYYYSLCC